VSWQFQQIPNPVGLYTANGQPWTPHHVGLAPAAADLFVCAVGNQLHFAYIAALGIVQDWEFDGTSGGELQQINNPSGFGPGVQGEFVACPQATTNAAWPSSGSPSSGLSVCPFGDQLHFAFINGEFLTGNSNGTIQDCWSDGTGQWNVQQINLGGRTDGPPAADGLSVCAFGDQLHFAYLGTNGTVWDCWYDGGAGFVLDRWNLQQINNKQINADAMTDGPPAAGGLSVCTFGNQQHFAYLDANGSIWDCWYDGSWNLQQINNKQINNGARTAGPPADRWVSVCAFGDQLHFAYTDVDGTVHDCWVDGTGNWNLQQINLGGRTGGPSAAGRVSVCAFDDLLHFAYVDDNRSIQDCWVDGTGNGNVQQINNGALTAAPPAVWGERLLVCAFGDQLHFAYLDGTPCPSDNEASCGNIWDCWWQPEPNPCQYWLDQIQNLSPGDFNTPKEYEQALAYYREKLKDCLRAHGVPIPPEPPKPGM